MSTFAYSVIVISMVASWNTLAVTAFTCPSAGVFADPLSCTTYYRCTSTLIAYAYTCPTSTYFNPATLKCSTTKPASCTPTTTTTKKPTTSTTTTKKPTTTSTSTTTTTTTTTEPPVDTTTVLAVDSTTDVTIDSTTSEVTVDSTTSTLTTPSAFVCPSAGVFPNGNSCTSYYRCSTTLVSYLYSCPDLTYFDAVALKCTATMPAACAVTTTPLP